MNRKIASELIKIAKELLADRYQTEQGTFKKMTPVEGDGKKSKFNGYVRYFMNEKGLSQESAEKMCAAIARKKGS